MDAPSTLVWSPTYEYIVERLRHHKQLRLLVAPFIKLDALERLLGACQDTSGLSVIVRWSAADIVAGVSDLDVYPFLRDQRVPLYLHSRIHLKLFTFNDSVGFHTSGNVTQRGLGLHSEHNIEIGCQVELTYGDWAKIYELLNQSSRVTDAVYDAFCAYRDTNASSPPPLPPLVIPDEADKRFSKLSLPSSASPQSLFHFYQEPTAAEHADSEVTAYMHDLALYQIPHGLNREQFFSLLGERFRAHAFVQAIVTLIQQEHTARFGLVNDWLTTNCSDKPTPYRWEMKSATRCLYEWLACFYEEISWDIPGAHSMVIRWINESA